MANDIQVVQSGSLVEFTGDDIQVVQSGSLVEFTGDDIQVVQVSLLIEYVEPVANPKRSFVVTIG